MFDIGEKVVCVNDDFPQSIKEVFTDLPKKDVVYVVRDVVPAHDYGKGETCAIMLIGLTGHINNLGVESGFAAHRFRELDNIKKLSKATKSKSKGVLV